MSKFDGVFDEAKAKPKKESKSTTANVALRHPGRRSDPNFVQANAYIPRELHNEVKLRLLQEGKRRQYSELVEELLQKWVAA